MGPLLGYRIEWRELSLYARLWGCRSGFENLGLEATTTEVALTAYGARAFDLGGVSLALGLGAGLDSMFQSFETRGSAPSRSALVPVLGILGNLSFGFADRFIAELDLHGETYFVNLQHAGASEASLSPVVSARATALLGVLF